jgi:hypothetical protein
MKSYSAVVWICSKRVISFKSIDPLAKLGLVVVIPILLSIGGQ